MGRRYIIYICIIAVFFCLLQINRSSDACNAVVTRNVLCSTAIAALVEQEYPLHFPLRVRYEWFRVYYFWNQENNNNTMVSHFWILFLETVFVETLGDRDGFVCLLWWIHECYPRLCTTCNERQGVKITMLLRWWWGGRGDLCDPMASKLVGIGSNRNTRSKNVFQTTRVPWISIWGWTTAHQVQFSLAFSSYPRISVVCCFFFSIDNTRLRLNWKQKFLLSYD